MKDRQVINHEINMLYRQLGKEVYMDESIYQYLTRAQKRRIKGIKKRIATIESMVKEDTVIDSEAIILEPEKNKDGFYEFMFCSHCQTGNNPKSTHCIKCNQPLH